MINKIVKELKAHGAQSKIKSNGNEFFFSFIYFKLEPEQFLSNAEQSRDRKQKTTNLLSGLFTTDQWV